MSTWLDYVEVQTIHDDDNNDAEFLTSRFVHQQLSDWSQQSLLLAKASQLVLSKDHQIWVVQHDDDTHPSNVVWLDASTDPLKDRSIPVRLYGYHCGSTTRHHHDVRQEEETIPVMVNDSTLVRILVSTKQGDWKSPWMGEACRHGGELTSSKVFLDIPPNLWSPPSYGKYLVGTTRRTQLGTVAASLRRNYYFDSNNDNPTFPIILLQDETPQDIVRYLRQEGSDLRFLSFGMMRAKYGAYADWGVACAIHSMAMEWAVRNTAGTIVLLEDAKDERLQCYIRVLSDSLRRTSIIPYPENPMYGNAEGGVRRLVRLRLVAIATPNSSAQHHRASIVRIPRVQSVETRLRGLRYALQAASGRTEELDDGYLNEIASLVSWARGSMFERIRHRIELLDGVLSKSKFETILGEFGTLPKQVVDMQEQAGGNEMAKQALQDAMNPEIELESLGITAPTGILLYGPPGTGKTLLAKSLSRSMIVLHSTDVAQSRVGQGEKAVSEAFEAARKRSEPVTVIFIDEFQALFTDRSSFAGGSRVTTTLFQCMDNLSRWRQVDDRHRIVVLAATNTPWMIDEAFLRPGRFDRTVYVDLPTCEERKTILGLHLHKMKLEDDVSALLEYLAPLTDGFSGADLASLCRAAVVQCLLDDHGEQQCPVKVHKGHFDTVLQDGIVGPSSDPKLLARIKGWRRRS